MLNRSKQAQPKTQGDIVKADTKLAGLGETVTDEVRIPGMEKLHEKTKEEIATTLAVVMKSRPGIQGIQWSVGDPYIRVTYIRRA